MEIQFAQPANAHWLWLVAVLAVATGMAIWWQRTSMLKFATPNLISRIVGPGKLRQHIFSVVLTIVALVAMTLALVDIRWGKIWRDVPQKGIEVMFVLDVSRSMLAEDSAPNRLERAKQDIKDIVAEMSGDRAGLVIFSGDVRRHIPLTSHYDDFRQALDEVGPHNISRGGSNIGEAITVASESFLEKTADHKAMVLFTDGEDHSNDPLEAAERAHEETGVRIYTVGLGDTEQGAKIPVQDANQRRSFVRYSGEAVWSKLDGETLDKIASATGGAYIPAGTRRVDMAGVYHRFIASMEQQEFDTARINTYVARYPLFIGFALGMMLLETLCSMWFGASRRGEAASQAVTQQGSRS